MHVVSLVSPLADAKCTYQGMNQVIVIHTLLEYIASVYAVCNSQLRTIHTYIVVAAMCIEFLVNIFSVCACECDSGD